MEAPFRGLGGPRGRRAATGGLSAREKFLTILNESGVPDVLHPLPAAGGLAERLPGALVVVAGTRAEAHLARSLSARSRGPRVAFVILDPEEEPPKKGRLASRVVEAAAG